MSFASWEPPFSGSESEHLIGMLNRLRATFRWKADGLTIQQLCRTIPSSQLTMGALLRYLAVCEDDIFAWKIGGERPEARSAIPEDADEDWQFTVFPEDTAEELYRVYDEAVARSQKRWAAIVMQGRLDSPASLSFGDIHPSVRRFVCDLIEEYGRHTGHADLIRESIDGRVGEDPPSDWSWPGALRQG